MVAHELSTATSRQSYIYLPENAASMDSERFGLSAKEFAEKTELLRRSKGTLILLLDGLNAHLKYDALKTLKDAGIVVIALPAHTSHALQPLDLAVFSATKQKYRDLLSERTISTRRDLKNEIFVIAELISKAYDLTLTRANIKAGFQASGICTLDETKVLQRRLIQSNADDEN